MQNAEEANLRAKMFQIRGDFEEGVGHRAEQQIVQFDFVLVDEGVQVMGQAEHHMEVRGLKKFPLSGRDPTLPCLRLTLGAMPIAAAIERDHAKPTAHALIAVSAQNRRATAHDRADHLQPLETDSVMVHESAALRAKDVGHLHGGPGHGFCFRLLDRFTVSSMETGRISMGLTTACK